MECLSLKLQGQFGFKLKNKLGFFNEVHLFCAQLVGLPLSLMCVCVYACVCAKSIFYVLFNH